MNANFRNPDALQTYNLQQNLMSKTPNFNMLNHPISSAMPARTTVDQINPEISYYQTGSQASIDKSASNNPLSQQSSTLCPSYNRSLNYYQEFWRMYLQNEVLITKLKEASQQNKETQNHISALEAICQELELSLLNNCKTEAKRKNRRVASEIEKTFTCPYQNCGKAYGSDVSLNLHIKLKHNGGNKTEREKLAKAVVWAQMNGEKGPDINLNLPPGFLETTNSNSAKVSKKEGTKDQKNTSKSSGKEKSGGKDKSESSHSDETWGASSTN